MNDTTQHEWDDEYMIAHAEAIGAHWAHQDNVDWFELSRDILRLLRRQRASLTTRLAETERERDALRARVAELEMATELALYAADEFANEYGMSRGYTTLKLGKEFVAGLNKRVESEDADNGE